MTTILTGNTPLWRSIRDYITFVEQHESEIWSAYRAGDGNAALIVELVTYGVTSASVYGALMIGVERYIHDYHPDIAVDGDDDELDAFAARIGLRKSWAQTSRGVSGRFYHYDVRPSKRALALQRDAVFMPLHDWIRRKLAEKAQP